MGKLRRFLKRLVKPAVMAFVAGAVAMSLVVGGSNSAHASVILPPPVLLGSGALPIADALALVAPTGPIGWTIAGVAVVGLAAYATKDYWLPYVQGAFGQPKDGTAQPSGSSYAVTRADLSLGKAAPFMSGLSGLGVTVYYSGGLPRSGQFVVDSYIKCKRADGTTYPKNVYNMRAYAVSYQLEARCNATTDTVLEGEFSAPCNFTVPYAVPCTQQSTYPGPSGPNATWGTGSGAGFDPKSPDVKYTATAECIRADGTKFTISKTSTGADGALGVPACGAVDPGSHASGKLDVVGAPPASTGQAPSTIYSVPAVPAAPGYELCAVSKPGPGCVMSVQVDGKPCVVGQWECAHWPELRNDTNQVNRLSCQYGPYMVTMDKCNPLERAYEVGGAPATQSNIDGDPSTRADTDPNGQQVPKNDPSTSTGVGTGVVPGTAGSPSAVTGGASPEESQCWPSGWGMLNPLEWVYRPVVCAAKALFEPKTNLQTRVDTMKGQFSNKVPISWFSISPDSVAGGTCPTDWAVEFRGERYSLICGTAADGILRSFRPVLGTMLTVAMLWPLIRSLFYSAIPVFKVTPS